MAVAGSLATAAGIAALCGTGPLDILLTNDDGADAVGIRALQAQLSAAGHHVTLVAPDHNASGTAMSFDWGPVRVTRDPDDPSVFAVSGSPATAVALGASALFPAGRRPDLVVSGINHGPNKGSLLVLSGTVGAALAGTLLLDPPVPGFAVNAERLDASVPVDAPANRAQLAVVAAHFARLVAETRGWFCEDGRVARSRTVLNVNYPARPLADVRGTVVARQGSATDLRVTFSATAPDEYRAEAHRIDATGSRDTDLHWLDLGYVTVTPVSGAIDAGPEASRNLQRRLSRL
jgi:5'/3'-nucleotidase SurE